MLVSDYVKLYGSIDKFHIDNHAMALQKSSMCCIQQEELEFQKIILNQAIRYTLLVLFSAMLTDMHYSREILEDSNFKQALHRIGEESIPYFSQFSNWRASGASQNEHSRISVYTEGGQTHQSVSSLDENLTSLKNKLPNLSAIHPDSLGVPQSCSDNYKTSSPSVIE